MRFVGGKVKENLGEHIFLITWRHQKIFTPPFPVHKSYKAMTTPENIQITWTTNFTKSSNSEETENINAYLQDYDFIYNDFNSKNNGNFDLTNIDLVFSDDQNFNLAKKLKNSNSSIIYSAIRADFEANSSNSINAGNESFNSEATNMTNVTGLTNVTNLTNLTSLNHANSTDPNQKRVIFIYFDNTTVYDAMHAEKALIDFGYFEYFSLEDIISKDNFIGWWFGFFFWEFFLPGLDQN